MVSDEDWDFVIVTLKGDSIFRGFWWVILKEVFVVKYAPSLLPHSVQCNWIDLAIQ